MTLDVFADIYRHNRWNGVESRSGPGSGSAATARLREELVTLVQELGVRSVLDAACGDGYWMPDLPGYVGIDVAPEAIRRAQARHPDRRYAVGDVRFLPLPAFDLVISRDAMQHLPLADVTAILAAIRSSGSRWLLASTYVGGQNVDVRAGQFYCPDLTAEPFALGDPDRLIPDGYDYATPGVIRDPQKFLGLWRLS